MIICKEKNNLVAEWALSDMSKPIGVSEYQLSKLVPSVFKDSLPTIEEIEQELKKMESSK